MMPGKTIELQYRHKGGGEWRTTINGVFDTEQEAEGAMQWLKLECPNLLMKFDYRIQETSAQRATTQERK